MRQFSRFFDTVCRRGPLLVLAAALLALLVLAGGPTDTAFATPGSVDLVALDLETTGNDDSTVGTISSCEPAINVNDTLMFDLVVKGVDDADRIKAYQFDLLYDPTVLEIMSATVTDPAGSTFPNDVTILSRIVSAGGAGFVDPSDTTPDSDGKFTVAVTDGTATPAPPANHESGDGVLARITVEAVGTGTSGLLVSTTGIGVVGGTGALLNLPIPIAQIRHGVIQVGGSPPNCTDTDGDGFPDAYEIAKGSDETSAASVPEFCDGTDNDLNDGVDEGFPDMDGDGLRDCVDDDNDNDGYTDAQEASAGSDPDNPLSTPEVCDGADNDLNDGTDEGFPNFDGDGSADCVDDSDSDSYTDWVELLSGSDPDNPLSTPEVCDGADNDLNDGTDEGFPNNDGVDSADCVDTDDDNDTVLDVNDNCQFEPNLGQADGDFDGIGDACEGAALVDLVALDFNTTGNDDSTIGTIESCGLLNGLGDMLEFDLVVQGVDATSRIKGYQVDIGYDPAVLKVTAAIAIDGSGSGTSILSRIASSGGAGFIDPSDTTPDTDGNFQAVASDGTAVPAPPANHESGDGVLARITVQAVGIGITTTKLVIPGPVIPVINPVSNLILVGGNGVYLNQAIPVQTVLSGIIGVGVAADCADDDADDVVNALDNCISVPNTDQANFDGDPLGDTCDADDDNDWIADDIDGTWSGSFTDESLVVSDFFTDQQLGGTSFGEITDRDGPFLTLAITDDPTPGGFYVVATGSGGPATAEMCGGSGGGGADISVPVGSQFLAKCMSVHLTVLAGTLVATADTLQAVLPVGVTVSIEEVGGILEITNDPSSTANIMVNGVTLTPGSSGDDRDSDSYLTSTEAFMGTDPDVGCGINAWPPDFNDDHVVNVLDIVQITPPVFGSAPPNPNYTVRKDFDGNSVINILDLVRVTPPVFGSVCT